ncbi:MAG: hypothetical protein ABR587_15000 [Candidatus Binatia bacterium]
MTITRHALPAALALAVCLTPLAASAAGTPDQSCRAAKLKAAGKYAAGLAGCESKAAIDASAPDAECLSKAATKIVNAFTKADTRGDSTCSGLEPSSSDDVVALVDDVLAAAPSDPGGGKCPSAVYKAGGKYASAVLSAWSKFVTNGDTAKRDTLIAKAASKLVSSISKGEEKDGCAATGQAAAVELAVENGIEALLACLAGTGSCAEAVAGAGDTVTTDPDGNGPDAETPVAASVATPVAGTVTLHVVDGGVPPSGYEILGLEVEVTAPDATAAAPLVLTFTIDASLLPPDPLTVSLARNGVLVADCSGAPGVASPDPCVESRTVVSGGDLEIVALSSQASIWSPLVAASPTTTVTTTTMTTTTTLDLPADSWMRWQLHADKVGSDVATEIDIGWSGLTHDIDPVDGSLMRFGLNCPSASLPGSYGECTVTGFDPAEGNCRCSNNTAITCDEPMVADADDCAGSVCTCYTRPPFHSVNGGTPVCLVARASSDASGTWNPDTGSGEVQLNELLRLHIGIQTLQPCPVCAGDATPNDGIKGGTCEDGQTPGAACDAHGTDPTYPVPTGGSTSYDCMPSNASNISGLGLKFAHVESTSAISLPSGIPCVGNISENCPCAMCSADPTLPCSSDAACLAALGMRCSLDGAESCGTNADCASVDVGPCLGGIQRCSGHTSTVCTTNADCSNFDAGPCAAPTCTSRGSGSNPSPNFCSSGNCAVSGDGEGLCDDPPNLRYCDGFLEEDGKPLHVCSTNSDCTDAMPSAGACTISLASECFPSTITATGVADSDSPRTVATLCVNPTSSSAANEVSGLPGPARTRTEWTVTYGQ